MTTEWDMLMVDYYGEEQDLTSQLTTRRVRLTNDSNAAVDVEFSEPKKASAVKSNVMCSDLDENMTNAKGHYLILDIDMPVQLITSSSGNNHLLLPKVLQFDEMTEVLDVLAKYGIVQSKWVESAKRHGFATLRLPGISKHIDQHNHGLDENGEIESTESYRENYRAMLNRQINHQNKEKW